MKTKSKPKMKARIIMDIVLPRSFIVRDPYSQAVSEIVQISNTSIWSLQYQPADRPKRLMPDIVNQILSEE